MDSHLNPWLHVPSEPPYLLPCDSQIISSYNAGHPNENYQVQNKVLPEPFIGKTTAPVVLLSLNPGFDDGNIAEHARAGFQLLIRNNYRQEWAAFPFYYLDPGFESRGRQWWEKKLKPLLNMFERNCLAKSILLMEYFPYHSRRFRHASLKLPSQEYGFSLVHSAIGRKAVVVIMRAKKQWQERIPELKAYTRSFTLKNPQNPAVSPGNCPGGGFDLIVSAIRDGDC